MPRNNAKRWAVISLIIAALGTIMTAAGFMLDDSDFYWMIMVGLMLGLTFFICFWVFLSQSRRLSRLFNREELMAHWAFDIAEQQQKALEEFQARKRTNRILLTIVTIFFVLIGGLFTVFGFDDLEDAAPFLLVMFVIWLIICIAALAAPRAAYKRMSSSVPEVYVGPFSAWVMGEYVQWKAPMTRARQIEFIRQGTGVAIGVHYQIRQRYGWQDQICRIPVPFGREQEAWSVAANLAAANQIQLISTP